MSKISEKLKLLILPNSLLNSLLDWLRDSLPVLPQWEQHILEQVCTIFFITEWHLILLYDKLGSNRLSIVGLNGWRWGIVLYKPFQPGVLEHRISLIMLRLGFLGRDALFEGSLLLAIFIIFIYDYFYSRLAGKGILLDPLMFLVLLMFLVFLVLLILLLFLNHDHLLGGVLNSSPNPTVRSIVLPLLERHGNHVNRLEHLRLYFLQLFLL